MLSALFILFFQSCSKEEPVLVSSEEVIVSNQGTYKNGDFSPPYDDATLTVLGQKELNPYLFENMVNAFNALGLEAEATNLVPNCHYYKFIPTTVEEAYDILEMEGEKIYVEDYPLEYEVVSYGAFYMDEEAVDTIIKPYYVLVYDNAPFNNEISHQLLEDGYIPKETHEKFEEIEIKAHQLIGLEEEQDFAKAGKNFYKPTGYVKVWDATAPNFVPVFFKSIVIRKRFKTTFIRTDGNGYFASSKKFYKKAKLKIRWWNQEYRITGHSLSDYLGWTRKTNLGASYNIVRSAKGAWTKATINNGLHLFNNYANNNGITPIDILHIWVPVIGKCCSGSAVMRKKLNVNNVLASFAVGFVNDLGLRIWKPSINGGSLPTYRSIHFLLFHELAHASQAIACGGNYWENVVDGEAQNATNIFSGGDPYRDGTKPTPQLAGYIGLAEGWAEFMSDNISHYYYPYTLTEIEDCNPQVVPSLCQDANGRSNLYNWWMPTGLFHDLYDATNESTQQTVFGGIVEDDCTVPMSVLFNTLKCVKNTTEYKAAFEVNWNPAREGLASDDCTNQPCLCLFEAYGY